MEPLYGVKVLDLTQDFAGAFCAMRLGDLGAEIIKLEPAGGCSLRQEDPLAFAGANREKKSVWMDLTNEAQKALFLELVKDADVVLESFQPGTLEKLGCGFADLLAVNPRLVLTSLTAYGQTGPMADCPAVDDAAIQALSGVMSVTGEMGGEPLKAGYPVADLMSSSFACSGTVAALHTALLTGQGSHVDIAKLDCLVRGLEQLYSQYYVHGKTPIARGNQHASCVPSGDYMTRDNRTILINISRNDQFAKLCDNVLGHPEILQTELADQLARTANRETVNAHLSDWFAEQDADPISEKLSQQALAYGEINTIAQITEHPQIRARGMIGEMTLPDGTTVMSPARPFRISGGDHKQKFTLTAAGADTRQVLAAYASEEVLQEAYGAALC